MDAYFIAIARQALYLTLILTLPVVGAAMLVGLIISLIQATTQVNEQTLTFVPKLVTVMIVLALFGPWALFQLVNFTNSILGSIPTYVK
ncbi:MAG: flagellar biosynthesis protein FliQ [bacterium]|nr:flagellar biosynthesis protein FliQ [bacterium]